MRDRLLKKLASWLTQHPRLVLLAVLLPALGSALAVPGLPIRAGHSSLMDHERGYWARFERFLRNFGSPNLLFVLASGGSAKLRRELMDQLAAELPQRRPGHERCVPDERPNRSGCVRDVLARIDVAKMAGHAMLYMDTEQLQQLVALLRRDTIGLPALQKADNLADLFESAASEVERRMDEPPPKGKAVARAGQVMDGLTRTIELLRARIAKTKAKGGVDLAETLAASIRSSSTKPDRRRERARAATGVDAAGYFASHDGRLHVAIVRPANDSDEPEVVVPFVEYVSAVTRSIAKRVGKRCADETACPDGELRVWFTGLPALVRAERDALNRDVVVTTVIAVIGVLLVFVFGFRSIRQGALAAVPLGCALLCTLAFVRFAFGGLNLITSAFMATVAGLGIDFSVHLLARYNEARRAGDSVVEGVRTAIVRAGPGMLTGGLTTSGAFVALAVSDFVGIAQLGIISAVGVLLSLVGALTVIPALLSLPALSFLRKPPRARRSSSGPLAAIPQLVVHWRYAVLVASALLTGFFAWRAQSIPWSYSYVELLPRGVPAVEGMKLLAERTDFSAEVAAVTARDIGQLRRYTRQLRRLSTVGRVESLASYVPEHQKKKLALLHQLRPLLQPQLPAAPSGPADLEQLRRGLEALTDAMQDARFAARRASSPAAKQLSGPIRALAKLRATIDALPPKVAAARVGALQHQLISLLHKGLSYLRANVDAKPITVESLLAELPASLRERLHGKSGFAIYVYPSEELWNKPFMTKFVEQLRSVDPGATGFPVTHWESGRQIEAGFQNASLVAAGVLALLLLVDFRSLKYTALAIVPLGLGLIWMWGAMSLLGLSYNYGNVIAFPLIIGIGVASGVHILHRFRQEGERDVPLVVRHTGLAVFLSAATTLVGFGSLASAQHRGAASIGQLLLIGVGACLIAATLVLPALLALLPSRGKKS